MGAKDERTGGNKVFSSITGDGRIKVTNNAEEGAKMGNKEAEIFKYIDTNKVEHKQWAFIFTSFEGYITDIDVRDIEMAEGRKITTLEITMEDNGQVWVISTGNKSQYAYSFLEKAVNIDFSDSVELKPWSWNKDGKLKKGVTLIQRGTKVDSYFWGDDKKRTNGYPSPEGDISEFTPDDWTAFFNGPVRKFLYNFLASNIIPKLKEEADAISFDDIPPEPSSNHSEEDDRIPEDDLPF